MRLRDKLTREADGKTYPAYVFTQTYAGQPIEHEQEFVSFDLRQVLRAVVKPLPEGAANWAQNERIEWQGTTYTVSYVARRRLRGKDHHYTLTLERIT